MNLLKKGCIQIYNQKAVQPRFFGRVSSQRWAICSSGRNTFHTFTSSGVSFLGYFQRSSLAFPSLICGSNLRRSLKVLSGSGLRSDTFEERYEIHFATETKPPFFELKGAITEFSTGSTERNGKDFRLVSESLGLKKLAAPEISSEYKFLDNVRRKADLKGLAGTLTVSTEGIVKNEDPAQFFADSSLESRKRKGRLTNLPSNPKKIWNDQFESVAFSTHLKSLAYSSEQGRTYRNTLPLFHSKDAAGELATPSVKELDSSLPLEESAAPSGQFPRARTRTEADRTSGAESGEKFREGSSLPSFQKRSSSSSFGIGVAADDENFLFPHDDLKSSLILRSFDMYPNERQFIGKTDNFSLKIASSAQIERVGTREKVETREGRKVLVRYGEVENSETVSYKDFKNPHPGGLYCNRIFGPIKNWVCTHPGCSDTKKGLGAAPVSRKGNDEFLGAPDGRGKYREFKCSVCGNGLYPSTLRRYRMGYIHLYQPLVHVSYIHSRQNLFSHLLRWNTKEIHSLIYNNLNLINFGHTELFSACFAPLFGFCDDSLGEALEWLRGDYFALSDQATVVLRLLQPRETQTAERLSKAKTKIPERMLSKRALRSLQGESPVGRLNSHQRLRHQEQRVEKTLWKKTWPREPNRALFSEAWKNSQNFSKKIESLLCPEIATVDTILLEDQSVFSDILAGWKKNFEVPKKRDLTILEKFQLEIFEQDPSPAYRVFSDAVFPELISDSTSGANTSEGILSSQTFPTEFLDILSERLQHSTEVSVGSSLWTSSSDSQSNLGTELYLTEHIDLFKVFSFPELEIFYQNTFGTLQSFVKEPESMYSSKFTKNSFFIIQDFLTKFQNQFFTKRIRGSSSSFLPKFERGQEKKRKSVLHWNPINFKAGQKSLDFICFRKDARKKSFLTAEGFCISPIWKGKTALTSGGTDQSRIGKGLDSGVPELPKLQRLQTARQQLENLISFSSQGILKVEKSYFSSPLEFNTSIEGSRVFLANTRRSPEVASDSFLRPAPFPWLKCPRIKPNQLNFFGQKVKSKGNSQQSLRGRVQNSLSLQKEPMKWVPLSSHLFCRLSSNRVSSNQHTKLAIAGLSHFEKTKDTARQKLLTELQYSSQRSWPTQQLIREKKLQKNPNRRQKALRALQFTPFQSVLKISESRQILVKPYFVISGIAQKITRPKNQMALSPLGFSLPLSHPAFAQNFVNSFNLSTKSKIRSLLQHALKKRSKIGRFSTDFLSPGNPFNSLKFFERSRIFDRNDVLEEFQDFLGSRNATLDKTQSLQFLSQENEFHNLLAFVECSPFYLKEQNLFLKRVHSVFFNPLFKVVISHLAAARRKNKRKETQQNRLLRTTIFREPQSSQITGIPNQRGADGLGQPLSNRMKLATGKGAGERFLKGQKLGTALTALRPNYNLAASSKSLQNSWNFSPRGAIREGDLLYGWLPSEHMMQRLIKLLGNASLGTNSPEVMLSQNPLEIYTFKKKKTRLYGWLVQKLLKGQDLHPFDKKLKSQLSLAASNPRGVGPLGFLGLFGSKGPLEAKGPLRGKSRPSALAPRANKGQTPKGFTSEPFPTGFRPEGPPSSASLDSQPLFRAEQFDSSQLEKEGTRFALSSFHRQLQNLLFQKQSRNGFKNYHCEEGATILTDPGLNSKNDPAAEMTEPHDLRQVGAETLGPEPRSNPTPPGLRTEGPRFSEVMESSELVSQSAFSSRAVVSPGAFLAEPEYDLNFLFDLKSPDDFGPWKRWPEFAKFFLYNGGPTLKKYFRSENWPQTALRLRKRIRRADPSVVFTKKISKLFEIPKYMGVSPEKWKTFLFSKVNRTKPGLVKEKITHYFREQRALLLAEEKRLKQEMRGDSKDLDRESIYWLVFDKAEAERRFDFEDEREKEFRTYKKIYRQRQKAIEKLRAQELKAQQRLEAQQRKEKEKQQKAFDRAQLKLQKEKEKEQKQRERLLKRQQEKQNKFTGPGTFGPKTIPDSPGTAANQNNVDGSVPAFLSEMQDGSDRANLEGVVLGSADTTETLNTLPPNRPEGSVQGTELSGHNPVPETPGVMAKQQSPAKLASHKFSSEKLTDLNSPGSRSPNRSNEEKFFETDEELFEYFCKFKYPPYTKFMTRQSVSKKAFAFYDGINSFGKSEQLAVLKAKRRKLRPNLVYIDSPNVKTAFEQFPFSAEDVGWTTGSQVQFANTLANPLWRNFLIHEMFKRNPLRDQKKLVKKDLVWEDFVTFQSYPLDMNSLNRHLTTSATPRGCLSRMNALVDFDQQIKRYDLTTRKADKKKADQYYQRFHEYLKALQQPIKSLRDDEQMGSIGVVPAVANATEGPVGSSLENIQTNPQFPFKKRTRKITDKKRLIKQYRAVLTLLKNPSCVERGVFDKFPILPPDLRPILQLGDVKAVSDITSLYILLIQRNIRHGKILFESYGESNEFLIDSKTMVQVAADNALDKCREKNVNNLIVGRILDYKDSATQIGQWASAKPKTKGPGAFTTTIAPRTLYDRLSGKEGRFRMNLLGKRVDYSGRSVIIVGPSLNVDQCGLPYEMALELFQPFVLRYMLEDPDKKVQKYLQYDPWIPDDTILDHLKLSAQLTEFQPTINQENSANNSSGLNSAPASGKIPSGSLHLELKGPDAEQPTAEELGTVSSEKLDSTEEEVPRPLGVSPDLGPELNRRLLLGQALNPGVTEGSVGSSDWDQTEGNEGSRAGGAGAEEIGSEPQSALPTTVSPPAIRPIKSLSQAKLILRKKKALGRMILRQIVPRFPVLLNRAPTLHRLGIQGFHPVLVYGRALHLHPLVCGSFNADFDGDQMAVHIPLSLKARFDIRMLMFAPVNWLSPATGQPTVVPSQDMVLGLFYMTLEKIALQKGRGAFFNTLSDAVQAYETGLLEIQSQIWVRWKGPFANNQMNDESSEESYEEHSKQGKSNILRSSLDLHDEDFQYRRKPFFSENENNFWKKKANFSWSDLRPGRTLSSNKVFSKKDLLLLRKGFKSTKENQQSTKGTKNYLMVSPFGTAGEMTVRVRWWNDFFDTRLVSNALRRSRQKVSLKGLQELGNSQTLSQESTKLDRFHPTPSLKESWLETSLRQKRRRQSGPVKYTHQKGFFYHSFGRFSNDEDEPIEIRIHQTGKSRKIYPDFQWLEDSKEDLSSRISYIRTTPGRALMNQLIYPSYEEKEPTGAIWGFQNPGTDNRLSETSVGSAPLLCEETIATPDFDSGSDATAP